MIEKSRRGFITGLISLVAAPAIVRAGNLMQVKTFEPTFEPTMSIEELLRFRMDEVYMVTQKNMARIIYGSGDFMPVRFSGFAPAWSFKEISSGFELK